MKPERRYGPPSGVKFESRDDGTGKLTGYAGVYWDGTPGTQFDLVPGRLIEHIMPGAFDRAVREDDVLGLFNHVPSMVLGRNTAGTMRLSTDARGLLYEIDLPATTLANDLRQSVSRGDIRGSSFAFLVTDETFRTENKIDIREIRGVQLFDVGPVTFPAYEATSAGVRSAEVQESWERWKRAGLSGRLAAYHARALEVSL